MCVINTAKRLAQVAVAFIYRFPIYPGILETESTAAIIGLSTQHAEVIVSSEGTTSATAPGAPQIENR